MHTVTLFAQNWTVFCLVSFVLCCNVVLSHLARTFDIVVVAELFLKFDIHKLCNRVALINLSASISCFGTYADR
jgi:hypothetical protein